MSVKFTSTKGNGKCMSCGYRFSLDGKHFQLCQYILVEEKMRPCKGGNSCTAYRKSKRPFEVKGEI